MLWESCFRNLLAQKILNSKAIGSTMFVLWFHWMLLPKCTGSKNCAFEFDWLWKFRFRCLLVLKVIQFDMMDLILIWLDNGIRTWSPSHVWRNVETTTKENQGIPETNGRLQSVCETLGNHCLGVFITAGCSNTRIDRLWVLTQLAICEHTHTHTIYNNEWIADRPGGRHMDDEPAGLVTPKFRKLNPCTRMGSDEYIDSTIRTSRVTYGPFVKT